MHTTQTPQLTKIDDNKLRWILIQIVILPVILFVITGALLFNQSYELYSDYQRTRSSDELYEKTISLLKAVVDIETGFRGYQLTNNPSALEPYYVAEKIIPQYQQQILELLKDSDSQKVIFQSAMKDFQSWKAWTDQAIEDQKTKNIFPSSKEFSERIVLMDHIRNQFAKLSHLQSTLRKESRQQVEKAARTGIAIILGVGIFFGLILTISSIIHLRKLSSNYNSLIESLALSHDNLEEKVRQRTVELMTVNTELESFCYSVSHDLRAPLRGIDGFSQALMEDFESDLKPQAKQYLGFIRQGVQRMGTLIDDLLGLSRLTRSEINLVDIDIGQKARTVFSEITAFDQKRKYEFKCVQDVVVRADRGLLRIALQNLLSNAWKYTSLKEKAEIELGMTQQDGKTVFFVRDNGIGFDMKYSNKLFHVFQRLHSKNQFEGTGVGLAIVSRVVKRHGGTIWAEAAPDQGATFYFTLE